jgi:hypothetical protein
MLADVLSRFATGAVVTNTGLGRKIRVYSKRWTEFQVLGFTAVWEQRGLEPIWQTLSCLANCLHNPSSAIMTGPEFKPEFKQDPKNAPKETACTIVKADDSKKIEFYMNICREKALCSWVELSGRNKLYLSLCPTGDLSISRLVRTAEIKGAVIFTGRHGALEGAPNVTAKGPDDKPVLLRRKTPLNLDDRYLPTKDADKKIADEIGGVIEDALEARLRNWETLLRVTLGYLETRPVIYAWCYSIAAPIELPQEDYEKQAAFSKLKQRDFIAMKKEELKKPVSSLDYKFETLRDEYQLKLGATKAFNTNLQMTVASFVNKWWPNFRG